MKRLQRSAIILSLIESLHHKGSWCGETHIQKSTYFLQDMLDVPLGFDFILYKHGPFSFDLNDELAAMRANDILTLRPRPPYGPSILPGPRSEQLKKLSPRTLSKYHKNVEFVARELSAYGVADLERLATAVYVTAGQSLSNTPRDKQAEHIHSLKPHISVQAAMDSLDTGKRIRSKANHLAGTAK